ncbi:glycosyltransferase family 4 protein [archaeon]|nr:glycosyltransferase family 4 protein [archaeon]MBT7392147.1 glycosyltransferase family 4 protein [archaeon]
MKFPTNHAVLTNVYADYLGKNHDVTWLMPREKQGKRELFFWRNIEVFTTKKFKERNFLFKLINYFSSYFMKRKILKELFKNNKFDIIQTRNDPMDALLAIKYSKKYRIPFVYQYSFPIYEKLIYTAKHGGSEFPRFFSYIFGHIGNYLVHKIIMKKADLILPISEWMKNDLIKKGILSKKLFPFSMGANVPKLLVKNKEICNKYKIKKNEKILIYLGNMDKTRNLGFLIEVFRKLKIKKYKFKVLMVGDGKDRNHLMRLCSEFKLDNVIFTGKVPYQKVNDYVSVADIGLSPFNPLPFLRTTSPTKLMEYMALGKPVVCNDTPEQKMVIDESKAGICVKYDVNEFVLAIESLFKKNKKDLEDIGTKGIVWVKKNREYMVLGKKLEEQYIKLFYSFNI